MFKKLFITILLVFSLNGHAFAHTGLESSSPQNGETISEEIQQIILIFETKIEQTSTIQVKSADGTEVPVKDITITDKQMVGNLETPLVHGDYQVLWNIIGADGHPIEGTFTFSVNKPNTEEDSNLEGTNTPSQPENNSDVTDNPSTNQTEAGEETPVENKIISDTSDETQADASSSQQSQFPSYLIPVIIGILVIVIAASFILMKRKKK
jgi:methionine-rich copper-binding protein CopC